MSQVQNSKNPAISGEQYRLAQAVLSGTYYSPTGMTTKVAREIVERTPKKLRSEFMKRNPGLFNHHSLIGEDEMEQVEELTRDFHGRDPIETIQLSLPEYYHDDLAELGRLVELAICDPEDNKFIVTLDFGSELDQDEDSEDEDEDEEDEESDEDSESDEDEDEDEVILCSTPDRKQLVLIGGDQELDLEEFDWLSNEERDKDLVEIGPIYSICYFTDKHHLSGPKSQKSGVPYDHKFGEDNGKKPMLVYDQDNQRCLIVGGTYRVEKEGIKN